MVVTNFAIALTLACSTTAAVIERQTTCSSYTIINTHGTGEAQGPSAGFRTMNVQSAILSWNSRCDDELTWTSQIINKIQTTLQSSPNECFILEGYSQGAAATVDALPRLTGASFTAVKGVFLIGDPEHKSGLTCNVDNNGGTTTRNVNGLSAAGAAGIPSNWIPKTLDVCIFGDGVCDTTHGQGINQQHLQYPNDAPTQQLGTQYITGRLRGTS